jgi:hypothetical protein
MVMKENLVSFVDSAGTLAPKTTRGERLAATKTAKTGFSQRFFGLRRMSILREVPFDGAYTRAGWVGVELGIR